MEFVSRLPRQPPELESLVVSKQNYKMSKREDKTKRKEKKDKRNSEPIIERGKSQTKSRRPQTQFDVSQSSDPPPHSHSQLMEEEMLDEWQKMRLEVNSRITASLVDNTYREILLDQKELNKLKNAKAKDSGLSLYKFGVVEDQATCLGFDDFIFYGIPRASITFADERVLTPNEPYYQQYDEKLLVL